MANKNKLHDIFDFAGMTSADFHRLQKVVKIEKFSMDQPMYYSVCSCGFESSWALSPLRALSNGLWHIGAKWRKYKIKVALPTKVDIPDHDEYFIACTCGMAFSSKKYDDPFEKWAEHIDDKSSKHAE